MSTLLIIVQAVMLTDVVVSVFVDGQDLASLATPLVVLVGVVAARAVLAYLAERIAFRSSAKAKSQLRAAVIAHVLRLGPVWLSERNSAELTQLVTRGIDGLDAYFARYLPQLILAVIVPVGIGAVIVTQDVLATVIIVVTLPLIPVFMVLIGLYTQRRVDRQWRVLARLSGHFADVVAGMPTLKVFGRAQAQAQSVRRIGDEYRRSTMGVLRISFLSALVLELLAMLSVALVAVSIGLRLVDGTMTLSAGLLVLILVPEVYLPLRLVGMHYHASAEGLGAAQQMIEILEVPTMPNGTRTDVPDLSQSHIVFRDVDLTYSSRSEPVLAGFNADLLPGGLTVLRGMSGSGKSTLLACIERFLSPDAGEIMVAHNGVSTPIDQFDVRAWRSRIAWVGQDEQLIPGTIGENVAFATAHAPPQQIEDALRAVDMWDVVEARGGLVAQVSPDGSGFSVGQRRRIILARALCQQAELVLLDEPLAALDAESQLIVTKAIRELAESRTVIAASHHDDLVAIAGNVVALDAMVAAI